MTKEQRTQFERWLVEQDRRVFTGANEYARVIAQLFKTIPPGTPVTEIEATLRASRSVGQIRLIKGAWAAYSRFLVALGAPPLEPLFARQTKPETNEDQRNPMARVSPRHHVLRCPCCNEFYVQRKPINNEFCYRCWERLWTHEARVRGFPPPQVDAITGLLNLKPIPEHNVNEPFEHGCAGLLAAVEAAKRGEPVARIPIAVPFPDYMASPFPEPEEVALAEVQDNTALEGTDKTQLIVVGEDEESMRVEESKIPKPKRGATRRVPYLPYAVTWAIWTIRGGPNPPFPIGHRMEKFPWRVIPDLQWCPNIQTQDGEFLFYDITGKTRCTATAGPALRLLLQWGRFLLEFQASTRTLPLVAASPRNILPASSEIIKASLMYWEKERGFREEQVPEIRSVG